MKELSLNILDIAENSVRANAENIRIFVEVDTSADRMVIRIEDDGCGMSPEFVERVRDPFTTTRTTRRVGLGIPLLQEAAQSTGGDVTIQSEVGKGTVVTAEFGWSHIDRMPLGDMASTISSLIQCNSDREFLYQHTVDDRSFTLDTRELRLILGGVPLSEPDIVCWIRDYVAQNITEINGGKNV